MKTSIFDKHRDTLEHHETMMGPARGRLAVAMDLLTDSLALVGQHGVYCRSERFPGQPKMDIALVLEQLADARLRVALGLVQADRLGDLAIDPHHRVERVHGALEDDRDGLPADVAPAALWPGIILVGPT